MHILKGCTPRSSFGVRFGPRLGCASQLTNKKKERIVLSVGRNMFKVPTTVSGVLFQGHLIVICTISSTLCLINLESPNSLQRPYKAHKEK
jgi:hypothetical protein